VDARNVTDNQQLMIVSYGHNNLKIKVSPLLMMSRQWWERINDFMTAAN
jgi:hypothetical protein